MNIKQCLDEYVPFLITVEGNRTDIQYTYNTQRKGFCPAPEEGKGFLNFEKAKKECNLDTRCTAITVDLEEIPTVYKKCQEEVDLTDFTNCCVYTKGSFESF